MKISTSFVLMTLVLCSQLTSAKSLSDYPHYEYDVRFTNPLCGPYEYNSPMKSVSGRTLEAKPENVYCKSSDKEKSADRTASVQSKLLKWIEQPTTKEIFFAYLSFSNQTVSDAICEAIEKRNVKVRFVLDQDTDQGTAKKLLACKPKSGKASDKPKMELRGHQGSVGYAHNKIFIINPHSNGKIQFVFSSGNLSAGVVLHHENWHFISTDISSYFAQAQLCLMNGMLDHGSSKSEYSKYISTCKNNISVKEEDDIKSFFVPGEGEKATAFIEKAIKTSKNIRIAAHRFSYNKLIAFLDAKLKKSKTANVQIVTDDDTYWVGTTGESVGPNMANEFFAIKKLVKLGAEVKWMETNHSEHLLHHNKYIVFDDEAVFAGAGNLTGDAFSTNFENFYYITIPEVVSKFSKQYDKVWNDLATSTDDMPVKNVAP